MTTSSYSGQTDGSEAEQRQRSRFGDLSDVAVDSKRRVLHLIKDTGIRRRIALIAAGNCLSRSNRLIPLQAKAACDAVRAMSGPGMVHVTVAHDDWCPLINGQGPCRCNPVVMPALTYNQWRRRGW